MFSETNRHGISTNTFLVKTMKLERKMNQREPVTSSNQHLGTTL